jgi:2,4-dienoyl-CoA reductase-like NADH-dependent reductase (Old Yellow Enzyme family)
VVQAVHAAGGKIAPQLWHVGMMRNAGRPKDDRLPVVGTSGMNVPGKIAGEPMTAGERSELCLTAETVKRAVNPPRSERTSLRFKSS